MDCYRSMAVLISGLACPLVPLTVLFSIGRIFTKTGHSGSPDERPDTYAVSNTLARLEHIQTPLLVMHGEEDVRAPFRQYELAVAELRKHGKVFESRSYPGEPHGLSAAARIDMYKRAEDFLNRYLKPTP